MIKHYSCLEDAIMELSGLDRPYFTSYPIGGGSINQCVSLHLDDGTSYFVKSNDASMKDMFETEALGLSELSKSFQNIPQPLALARDEKTAWLIMECVEQGEPKQSFWIDFGRNLALMHGADGADEYGWHQDNYIGSTVQVNSKCHSWIDFFKSRRLLFQGRLAMDNGLLPVEDFSKLEKLCENLGSILFEPKQPELIHGDLWNGNFLCDSRGHAWMVDPAPYYGHGESDLAMTEMFGGFSLSFYRAYKEIKPVPSGYSERRDIYNLYHYLNHLNLFGKSYYGAVHSIIQRYC